MTPRDHVDQTLPLPQVPDGGARHAHRRRTGPGWEIAVMMVLTVPLGLGLGWLGPDLLGGGPSSDPRTRYEPDIPRYPTTPPPNQPPPGRNVPAYAPHNYPRAAPGRATPHRRTGNRKSPPPSPATPLPAAPLVTPPATADPFTTTPTPTGTAPMPALRTPIHLTVESTPMATPPESDTTQHMVDDLKERVTSPAWTGADREETLLLIAEISRLRGAVVSAHTQLLDGFHADALGVLEAALPPAQPSPAPTS